jgi:hypothetical protein
MSLTMKSNERPPERDIFKHHRDKRGPTIRVYKIDYDLEIKTKGIKVS